MLEIKLGRKYKHSRTKKIYELVKIDKTPQATWLYLSKDGETAMSYGRSVFLNSFEEVKEDKKEIK
jgi:ABC-type Fe3+/spermidine/putrescine transport system ATPase subunit